MKKIYFILAAIAMVSMFSCKKDDGKKDDKKGSDEEATSIIVIDGKFDDWAKVNTKAEVPDGVNDYGNLLLMKAIGDEENIYLYFECQLDEEQTKAPIDLFFDSDNNAGTGFISWLWAKDGCGWEYMVETENGYLDNGTAISDMSDMAAYICKSYQDPNTGEQVEAWGTSAKFEKTDAKEFVEVKGVVKNEIATFELSIPRNIVNANKKGTINIGASIYKQPVWNEGGWYDWPTAGVAPLDAEGVGKASFLAVALP